MAYGSFKQRLEKAMADNDFKNANQLATAMGYTNAQKVWRLLDNEKNLPSLPLLDELEKVLVKTDFKWLCTGRATSNIYDNQNQTDIKQMQLMEPKHAYLTSVIDKKAIPLVDVRAAAGFGSASFSIQESDIQAHYVVPDFEEINFMLRVVGNSMYPKYTSGDVIACRIVKNIQFIQWGKAYLVATGDQGLLIKRLMPTNDARIVEMQSDNTAYPPFLLNIADIHGLALVVGTIRLE